MMTLAQKIPTCSREEQQPVQMKKTHQTLVTHLLCLFPRVSAVRPEMTRHMFQCAIPILWYKDQVGTWAMGTIIFSPSLAFTMLCVRAAT